MRTPSSLVVTDLFLSFTGATAATMMSSLGLAVLKIIVPLELRRIKLSTQEAGCLLTCLFGGHEFKRAP